MYTAIQTRMRTALILTTLGLATYMFLSPFYFAVLLLCIGLYCLFVEYAPLYRPWRCASYTSLALIYLGLYALLVFNNTTETRPLILVTFFLAACADSGAYIVGKKWGRHKLAPTISPGKTWEGFIGGWCTTTLGLYVWLYTHPAIPHSLLWYVFAGLLLALSGLCGDLIISQLKRNANAKDTGTILPGHGGLLDRLDSVFALAIVLYAAHMYYA